MTFINETRRERAILMKLLLILIAKETIADNFIKHYHSLLRTIKEQMLFIGSMYKNLLDDYEGYSKINEKRNTTNTFDLRSFL